MQFDQALDLRVTASIEGIIAKTGSTVISDGWTSCANRPIINALMDTPVGAKHLCSTDTSGEIKSMEYIAEFVIQAIIKVGPQNVSAVCMDGACFGAFAIIVARFPHIHCFICPTHSEDGFIKNMGCNKPSIRIKRQAGVLPWGEDIFSKPMGEVDALSLFPPFVSMNTECLF